MNVVHIAADTCHIFCPRHIRQREVVSFRDADRNDCHILCIGYRHPRCCLPYLLQVLTLNNNRYGNSKSEIPPDQQSQTVRAA